MSRKHEDWINDFADVCAPACEAPRRYLYWSAVAAVGGALRRRASINMGTFKWYPNWFIVLVGPAGIVHKSTSVDLAMNLLREVEGIHFGPDVSTWEGFITEVAAAQDVFTTGPAGQSIVEQTYDATCAITMAISEWGTFLDPENRMMITCLTDLWDCRDTPWRKQTKTSGSDQITAPFVNMIAGTTPDWLAFNLRKFKGWGFTARCIFLHCEKPERYIPYPDEVWGQLRDTWRGSFISDLREIALMEGEFTLSPSARELGRDNYVTNKRRMEMFASHPHRDPWAGDFLGRLQTHSHKLAMCLSAARRSTRVIEEHDLREAIERCGDVERELGQIFGGRATEAQVQLNLDVWRGLEKALTQHGRIRASDIYRFTVSWMTKGRADEMLAHLKRADMLKSVVEGSTEWLEFGQSAKATMAETAAQPGFAEAAALANL